ncbi:hypothetical protein ACIP98_40140, partial [Streptomyces sp. NPDC088354]|uniref:hypothetical protein n=1 Tax=Streptomyces sp. NPDC088354 TaxID=3365856 RepID=UPI0037FABF9A
AQLAELARLLEAGTVRVAIDSTFALADARAASNDFAAIISATMAALLLLLIAEFQAGVRNNADVARFLADEYADAIKQSFLAFRSGTPLTPTLRSVWNASFRGISSCDGATGAGEVAPESNVENGELGVLQKVVGVGVEAYIARAVWATAPPKARAGRLVDVCHAMPTTPVTVRRHRFRAGAVGWISLLSAGRSDVSL